MKASENQAWDNYWAKPRLAACLRSGNGNYGGEIAKLWRHYFSFIPRSSRVLDLATGNGAIALLALECSDNLSLEFQVEAVDAADINPALALPDSARELDRIIFHPGVMLECLPFEDGCFDALSGQYALEYSDLSRALPEAARVLKPGGELMFITHTQNSSVYHASTEQLATIAFLVGLQLSQMVRRLASEPDESAAFTAIKAEFDKRVAAVFERMEQSAGQQKIFIGQYLRELGEAFKLRKPYGADRVHAALEALDRDLQTHEARLQALQSAAFSRDKVEKCLAALKKLSLNIIDSEPVHDDSGQILGHRFRLKKGSCHS